jgi:hypothetical protein
MISPTHKRTEGQEPVLGSRFTAKSPPREDSEEFAPRLNVFFLIRWLIGDCQHPLWTS